MSYGSRCLQAALRQTKQGDEPGTVDRISTFPLSPISSSEDPFFAHFDKNHSQLQPVPEFFLDETTSPFENPVLAELQPAYIFGQPQLPTEMQAPNGLEQELLTELHPLDRPTTPTIESEMSDNEGQVIPENTNEVTIEYESEEDNGQNDQPEIVVPQKKKRNRIADPQAWKRNVDKAKRMRGEAYNGIVYSREKGKTKEVPKNAINLGARCGGKICDMQDSKTVRCSRISDESRQKLFDMFWKELDWDQRRIYVCSMVDVVPKKETKKGEGQESRRSCSLHYHLKVEDQRIRVCTKMFQNTLQIPHRTIIYWLDKGKDGMIRSTKYSPMQERTKGKNAHDKERVRLANIFDQLDKIPSHYCRKSSTKKYLWPYDFKSAQDVYTNYRKWIEENHNNSQPLSATTFKSILKEENIEI
jgi:hypothetical protein